MRPADRTVARPVVRGTIAVARAAPAARAGDTILMRWVDAGEIPMDLQLLARLHVDSAARLLGLGHITVRWFEPALGGVGDFAFTLTADHELAAGATPGASQPMTIAINAGLRGEALVRAVCAHELKHVQQHELAAGLETLQAMLDDGFARLAAIEADAEADCNRFAAAYVASTEDPR